MDTYPHFYPSAIDGKTIIIFVIINVIVWRWVRKGAKSCVDAPN